MAERVEDKLRRSWPDFVRILSLENDEGAHRDLPIFVVSQQSPTWREAEHRIRSRSPHVLPEELVLGITEIDGRASCYVSVLDSRPRYLDFVGLPALVWEHSIHEAFHLAVEVFIAPVRELPLWLHEGTAWAVADRALHGGDGDPIEHHCHLCARGLSVLWSGTTERPLPSIRSLLRKSAAPEWSFAVGLLMRVVVETDFSGREPAHLTNGPRSLVPLYDDLAALPGNPEPEDELAALLRFVDATEDRLQASLEQRRSQLPVEWVPLQANAQIEFCGKAMVVSPFFSEVGVALRREPIRSETIEIRGRIEILFDGATSNIQVGYGTGASVALGWRASDRMILIQQRNPIDGEIEMTPPLPAPPEHPGPWREPLPFRFIVSPDEIRIAFRVGTVEYRNRLPRSYPATLAGSRCVITAEAGPAAYSDLEIVEQ